ncbi:MAG: hydrogen peroxide-inducible genes activator [Gammaproteobacteria bacterium]|nr:hydrogen peroxide-inducible genes activator [Gammaproteobacteria bacterium]
MISLKQIQYVLAVERTLHFKRAAENCAISQSALSTALAEMEKQLGFQVFERNNKQVLVTPLGRQALAKARQIQLQVDDLMALGAGRGQPLSAPMSLGIIPTICPYLLPVVLPELKTRYPDFQLQIAEEQSHLLLEQVRSGILDAAILALPYECAGLLTFKFWEERFYWVTRKDDPVADKPQIGSAELDPTQMLLLKEGHCLKDHVLAVCHLSDMAEQNLGATSLGTLVQLVANGMGTTLVPAMALAPLVSGNPRLASVALAEPGPHREIAFVVRPTYPNLADIELLMQIFRQQLSRSEAC